MNESALGRTSEGESAWVLSWYLLLRCVCGPVVFHCVKARSQMQNLRFCSVPAKSAFVLWRFVGHQRLRILVLKESQEFSREHRGREEHFVEVLVGLLQQPTKMRIWVQAVHLGEVTWESKNNCRWDFSISYLMNSACGRTLGNCVEDELECSPIPVTLWLGAAPQWC